MSPDPKRDKQEQASQTAPTRRLNASELQRYREAARSGRPPSADASSALAPRSTQKMDAEQLRRFRRAAAGAEEAGQPLETDGPRLVRAPSPPWHALDHEESLLLARIDGRRDRAAVIDGSGVDEVHANKLIDSLINRGLASIDADRQ